MFQNTLARIEKDTKEFIKKTVDELTKDQAIGVKDFIENFGFTKRPMTDNPNQEGLNPI